MNTLSTGFVLPVVLQVADRHQARARYVIDTLMMAAGVGVRFHDCAPSDGPWLRYSEAPGEGAAFDRCLALPYRAEAWAFLEGTGDVTCASRVNGLDVVLPGLPARFASHGEIGFDLLANAFYFLSSWSERRGGAAPVGRQLHDASAFARLGVKQDVVDDYLRLLVQRLSALCTRLGATPPAFGLPWPRGATHAVVLSHDVDFLPKGVRGLAAQAARTVLRHLVRHRDPADALRAVLGLARCIAQRRDPYGCLPAILEGERSRGVRSSFQVAVGRLHPADVNYDIHDDAVRDYLRAIVDAEFDLCLHGSYRSTEAPGRYEAEVELLARRLGRPRGNRQHYLCFDYDTLFGAQERAGIRYDMSMGFPDRPGPRCGFSFPYFPYCLDEDRPYDVVEIGLSVMDVTLRSYLRLKGEEAWAAIDAALASLASTGGCSSIVWHPIVFGGARDPGYDRLYWKLVDRVQRGGGLATDGRTIDRHWRERARCHASFAGASA